MRFDSLRSSSLRQEPEHATETRNPFFRISVLLAFSWGRRKGEEGGLLMIPLAVGTV